MLLPTESPAVLPTRELLDDTTPDRPTVPLTQVTAPAFKAAPLAQSGLEITKLPLGSTLIPPLPTWSLAALPVNELIRVPAGLYKYTTPTFDTGPSGSVTTKLPLGKTATAAPKAPLPRGP